MAYIFEDEQPQINSPQFVFEDVAPIQAVTMAPVISAPPLVKQKGILESTADAFSGAGARVAQGVNESLGAINEAFGFESTVYKEGSEYWRNKAEEAGSSGLPAKIYEGVGAAPAGVAEFIAGPVYAGVKGAVQGYREDRIPGALEKAAIEVTKRVGLGKIFHGIENTSISGLTKAAAMGGTMGVQTAAEQVMTDEGIQPQAVAASAITGTLLSISAGGKSEVIRRNLIKEGVQPEIARDFAGRVPEVFPTKGTGRFVFDDTPVMDTATEVSKGSISNPLLDPARQAFIKDKVEGLGSIEAVDKLHPTDSISDVYARQVGAELFGTPEARTSKFPLNTIEPLETSKMAPESPSESLSLSVPSLDAGIKPENTPLLLGDASKSEVHQLFAKELLDAQTRGELSPEFITAKMNELGLTRENPSSIPTSIESATPSEGRISPSFQNPLEVAYHLDKKVELLFSETPDQKMITRLRANHFEDQGADIWVARGDGKARRDFVDKIQGELASRYARVRGETPIFETQKDIANSPPHQSVEPWTMSREELFTARDNMREWYSNLEDSTLGSQANEWRRATARGNTGVSDRIESTLKPKDVDALYGNGTKYAPKDFSLFADARDMVRTGLDLNGYTEQNLAKEIASSLYRVGREIDPKKMTLSEKEAFVKLDEAYKIIDEQGWDTKTVSDGAIKKAASHFNDPADAAFMLNRFIKASEKPTSLSIQNGKSLAKSEKVSRAIENKGVEQVDTFPHNGGVILDNIGLQQIYERITSVKLIRDVMDDVKALGRHVFAGGNTTWKTWFDGMKETLGSRFAKVRPVMERVWKSIDNERGSIRIEAPRLRKAWDGLLRAVNPMERGELALKAGELLRERMGVREMNRVRFSGELDAAVKKYEEKTGLIAKALDNIQNSERTLADKVFNKLTEEEAYSFMQAMDTSDKAYFANKPALNDIAAVIDSMFQAKVKEIQNLGTGVMQNVRESYFPHIWEKKDAPEQVAKIMGRRPLEGNKNFTKQRIFEDVQAGLDAGYKPISQNPLDLVFLKMTEMDKYIAAHKGLQAMEGSGIVQLIPVGERVPEGFFDIAGKYGIVTKEAHQDPASGIPGETKSYRYVAVDEVAQVYNNYLSQSLHNNKYIGDVFTGYMGVANHLNQFQLGVGSLFHGGFTSLEAVISRFSLGLKALSVGDLKGSAEYFATSPVAMVSNWKLGQKVLDAMKSGSAPQGGMADIMDWLQLAGARTAQDERFRTNQTQKVLQSWSNGKHFGAVAHSPLAVVEQSSRIILEHIVPQQKMGVFVEMMKQWVDSNPKATHEELRTAAQAKWSRADARLGQVVYERYFIHNAVKNGLQALIRAPGWTGGTIFELGGGTKDALESITKLAKGEKTELSDRTAYAISLVTVSAIANGLATLFFTGDMPKGMDFLAFRSGNLDEKGKPERFVLPTYMKDLYAYSQAPGSTLLHKAHPVIGLAGDLVNNQDFYGTEIRHSGDNPAKQVFDTVFHTAKAFTPFWMRGVAKERERGGSIGAQVAPFFGVMPASAAMNATAAEKKALELVVDMLPRGSRTREQFEKSQLKRKIETALRKKDPEARVMIQQAKRDKLITAKDEQDIRKAAVIPLIVSRTRSLDFPEAMLIWEQADKQEKTTLRKSFMDKGERYIEAHPEKQKEVRKQIQEISRFVGGTNKY